MTDKPKTLPNLSKDFSISDKDSKIFNANLDKVNAMNKPKVSAEDKEWISKNDSLTKFGFDIEKDVRSVGVYTTIRFAMEDFAKQEVKEACKEQHRSTRHQAAELCAKEGNSLLHAEIMNLNQIEPL